MTAMGLAEFAGKTYQEVLEEVDILSMDGQIRPVDHAPLLRALRGEIVRGEEIMRHRQTGRTGATASTARPPCGTRRALSPGRSRSSGILPTSWKPRSSPCARDSNRTPAPAAGAAGTGAPADCPRPARRPGPGPTAATFTVSSLLMGMENPEMSQQLEALREQPAGGDQGAACLRGELRPPALARFGLSKGIQSHLEVYQQQHPELSIQLI